MTYHPQVVVIGEDIYIGGGHSTSDVASTVMHCKTTDGGVMTCKPLPPHVTENFGMAEVERQLILVGGTKLVDRKKIGKIYRWDTMSRSWKSVYRAVPTAQSSPCVVTYDNKFLIVIGGVAQSGQATDIVEKLELGTNKWSKCFPLPIKASLMTHAISGHTLYIGVNFGDFKMGPSRRVIYTDLNELIAKPDHIESASEDCKLVWNTLPDAKLYYSALFATKCDCVYSVGGHNLTRRDREQVKTEIYSYNGNEWVLAGALHQPRYQCTCSLLSDQKLIVVGGVGNGEEKITQIDTYSMVKWSPESY